MKITVKTSELQNVLRRAKVATGGNLPVLYTVLIQATDKGALVHSSNLEIYLTQKLDAEVHKPGEICLSCAKLLDIATRTDAGHIEIEVSKGRAAISAGRTKATLHGMRADEFPALPAEIKAEPIKVSMADIAKVAPAISQDLSRYAINGVLFEIKDGRLNMVATDGRRLHNVEREATQSADGEATVPSMAIRAALTLFKADAALRFDGSSASFEAAGIRLLSRIIDAKFPNWRVVIPAPSKKILTAKTAELIAAIERCGAFEEKRELAGRTFSVVTVKIQPEENECHLNASSIDGEISHTIGISGEIDPTAADGRFLIEALKHVDGESVNIDMADNISPLVIQESGFTAVVMPMRVTT